MQLSCVCFSRKRRQQVYGDSNCWFLHHIFFQEFVSRFDQNSAQILIRILGEAADYSYRFEIKNNIEYPCHCHKIDFIIFSSFCFVVFQIIIINIFFHHSKKNANVMTRKKMVFFF